MNLCGKKKSHVIICVAFLVGALIIFDQTIKWFILHTNIVKNMCNYGIAMGIILPQSVFFVLWLVIMMVIVYFLSKKINQTFAVILPYIFILAGGVSNVIDRMMYGCVVDYIPLLSISSFNFADALITIGAILILWQTLRKSQKENL